MVRKGFEPLIRFHIHAFQACSLSLSDISPVEKKKFKKSIFFSKVYLNLKNKLRQVFLISYVFEKIFFFIKTIIKIIEKKNYFDKM